MHLIWVHVSEENKATADAIIHMPYRYLGTGLQDDISYP
jgi:hypothetical protein